MQAAKSDLINMRISRWNFRNRALENDPENPQAELLIMLKEKLPFVGTKKDLVTPM